MDNLVLIRVAASFDTQLSGMISSGCMAEGPHRFRLRFESDTRRGSVLVSLMPQAPWIGRPLLRTRKADRAKKDNAFAAVAAKALSGRRLDGVHKAPADRRVEFRFSGGERLVVEMLPATPNLVLVDPGGRVVTTARRAPSTRERLQPGRAYAGTPLPRYLVDPFTTDAETLARIVDEARSSEAGLADGLQRRLAGLGRSGARLAAEEVEAIADRLAALVKGRLDPVVLGAVDPMASEADLELRPWALADDPRPRWSHEDPAATAGLFYDRRERAAVATRRLEELVAVLVREIGRNLDTESRVRRDLDNFQDPDRYGREADALLAGLHQARRVGDYVHVDDPLAPGSRLEIPVAPGVPLPKVAEGLYARQRRARRGLAAARSRLEKLEQRRQRMEQLRASSPPASDPEAVDALEASMRAQGIAVGWRGPKPAGRRTTARISGVRVFTADDGSDIFVGKSGLGNDRVTFKVAGPEDFWFHALGVPGAHVVVRNPDRLSRPSPEALERAAGLAARFSDAGKEERVDVQWTRRKYVRRIRGAQPGTVTVKRSETVRVAPAAAVAPD